VVKGAGLGGVELEQAEDAAVPGEGHGQVGAHGRGGGEAGGLHVIGQEGRAGVDHMPGAGRRVAPQALAQGLAREGAGGGTDHQGRAIGRGVVDHGDGAAGEGDELAQALQGAGEQLVEVVFAGGGGHEAIEQSGLGLGTVEGGGQAALLGFGGAAGAAAFGFADLARQADAQARQAPLDEVVVSAGAHGGDGAVFADGARDDDEGQIGLALTQQRQRFERTELGQAVVGNDGVPGFVEQGGAQGGQAFDAAAGAGEALCAEGFEEQHVVVFGIFDDEQAPGRGHGGALSRRSPGRSARGALLRVPACIMLKCQ
jgi:hypothetical protein